MTKQEKILLLAKNNGGTITAKQINEMGISNGHIYSLVNKGELERSSRGVYILPNNFDDEIFNLQARFRRGVFSKTTALYLLGFSDRTPIKFDITFPYGYNTMHITENINISHNTKELFEIGLTTCKTPYENTVNVYCIERTLCDILKTRNAVDIQVITDAFKQYAKYKEKNIPKLSEYAKIFKVEKKVRAYLEVLI